MNTEIYILDLIGTFAFASYGSFFAIKKDFDIFGIFVCAALTAVGGGTIREVILQKTPFHFLDPTYALLILIAMITTILIYNAFHKIEKIISLCDSIGLVTFAFIGASKAVEAQLGLFGVITLATITAIGGGIIRDLILNKTPEIMHRDFYASIAIILGFIYYIFSEYMQSPLWANLLIASCLLIRLLAVRYKINLWKPTKKYSCQKSLLN